MWLAFFVFICLKLSCFCSQHSTPPDLPSYPFTTQITDPAARTRSLNCEIQNGRGAMLGVTGCMIHSMLDSTDHHFFYPITHN